MTDIDKTERNTPAKPAALNKPLNIRKQVGSVVYEVRVHFSESSKETMDDIKLRLVRREAEAVS